MTLLLDTSVLIDHLRGKEAARRALATAVDDGERLVSSVVVKVEVLAGMRSAEEHHTRRLLDALYWIPVDDDIAERAGLPPCDCIGKRSRPPTGMQRLRLRLCRSVDRDRAVRSAVWMRGWLQAAVFVVAAGSLPTGLPAAAIRRASGPAVGDWVSGPDHP
jgi:hypothetical protein